MHKRCDLLKNNNKGSVILIIRNTFEYNINICFITFPNEFIRILYASLIMYIGVEL